MSIASWMKVFFSFFFFSPPLFFFYMSCLKDCLTHPRFGYYTRKDKDRVLGQSGDFVTSVELSPVFCGMLSVWARHALAQLQQNNENKHEKVLLLELGPGSGKLASAAAKALKKDCANVEVHLVEASSSMRESQRRALGDTANVTWHDSVRDMVLQLPKDGPVIAMAHEYFDALPIYRFRYSSERGWCEEMVDISPGETGPLPLRLVLSRGPTPPVSICLGPSPPQEEGARVEVSPDGQSDMALLSQLLASRQEGGAGLIIDYGEFAPAKMSLRAISGHTLHEEDPMSLPAGEVDLSVDVDFRLLNNVARQKGLSTAFCTQRDFLRKMGIEVLLVNQLEKASTEQEVSKKKSVFFFFFLRKKKKKKGEELISQYNRIVDEMGQVYKVLIVGSDERIVKSFQ